jgi:nucleotide-binding universal stress UspA family protein
MRRGCCCFIEESGTVTDLLFSPLDRPDYRELAQRAFHDLESIDADFPARQVDSALITGPIAASILKVASEQDADVIVMGTHGRTGLKRLLMGSVAEEVSRRASCPVVMVRSPQIEDA